MNTFGRLFMYLLALVLSSAVLSLSCAETGGYSTNDGAISSNDLRNDEKLRASMLSDVVEKFWELSLEDNRIKLADFVGETPDEFWTACPPASKSSPQDDSNLSFQKDGGLRGEENEVSKSEKADLKWQLDYFSSQIKSQNLKLLKTRIVDSNQTEAIVKIDWSRHGKNDGFLSQYLLLFNRGDGWRIFAITDPIAMSKYNRVFGSMRSCVQGD